jgi:hypothetical protein
VSDDKLEKLAQWYRQEYQRRTEAVKEGTAKIDWIVPDYRVSRTEVESYAASIGIDMNAQDSIDLFHYLNQSR